MYEIQYQWRRLRRFLWGSPEPVTRTVIALSIATFLIYFVAVFFFRAGNPWGWLEFSTLGWWRKPWSLLTYPLVTKGLFTVAFANYWLWIVGGTLERSWGSRSFAKFFAGVTAATSVGIGVGSLLLGALGLEPFFNVELSGLWLPLAGLTVAWCLLNPDQVVLLGFVLPIPGRILMWITVAFVYFGFAMGYRAPWLAFFALAGVGVAYAYTRRRLYVRPRAALPRPPTPLEKAVDWALFRYERLKRRVLGGRRRR